MAVCGQSVAEFGRPGDHLRAEPHDQQDGVVARNPEGVVFDLQSIDLSLWHPFVPLPGFESFQAAPADEFSATQSAYGSKTWVIVMAYIAGRS